MSRSEDARILDPEDPESLPRFLSAQARRHGRQVWLHLLSSPRRWQLAPEWARIEAEAAVLEQIGEDYRFLDRQSYSCQGLSFVISRFVHWRTEMPMHLIPGGRGVMGSDTSETGRFSEEGPAKQTLIPAMMMAQFPVTQRQWETIGGPDFRRFSDPERPIERVSWNDARDWIRRAGGELRLPSEAEWEYACRAGSTSPYFFGATAEEIDQYAWYGQNAERSTQKVGQKRPNAFGLHDIVGNVSEWCEDDWLDSHESGRSDFLPYKSGDEGGHCVRRSGDWNDDANYMRSAYRMREEKGVGRGYIGFRVARSLNPAPSVEIS